MPADQTTPLRRLEDHAAAWLKRRKRERMLCRFGGIQRCPWCRQVAQDGEGWSFVEWEGNPFHDVLTCGVCGGTSVWHFAMGMHAIGPLTPPSPDPDFPDHVESQRTRLEAPRA